MAGLIFNKVAENRKWAVNSIETNVSLPTEENRIVPFFQTIYSASTQK